MRALPAIEQQQREKAAVAFPALLVAIRHEPIGHKYPDKRVEIFAHGELKFGQNYCEADILILRIGECTWQLKTSTRLRLQNRCWIELR